jgi:hypothetical protein
MPFFPQFSNLFVAPYVESPFSIGLLAYWKLDTTGWIDSSGNGKTLTNNNGVTLGTGKINGDAVFDATSFNSLTANISIGSSYTISAWIKIPASGFAGGACAIGSSSNNNSPAIVTTYDVTYFFYGFNGDQDCNPATSAGPLDLDTWYHIAGTSDAGSSTGKWYLNATLISEDLFSSLIGTDELQLGAYDARALPTFSGEIDEVGVWNRALTGAEITSLYNAGAGKTYPFD